MTGPLAGIRVVELAGLGPAPFAGMMLADMGAEVIRVDRPVDDPATLHAAPKDPLNRGRRSIVVDLKRPEGTEVVLRLCERSDGFIEGFRPGVAERLGLGPGDCHARNPRLVYGRMTGWGQTGPLAPMAGHDINYIGLTGALAAIGPAGGPPVPPINLVGDFGGGGMLLAFGMACGLIEASRSGVGQVVDAAMVDGAALLMSMIHGYLAQGRWSLDRGTNRLDGGAHFYGVYECADGKYVAVGAIEPQFYARLLHRLGINGEEFAAQHDTSRWPARRDDLAAAFRTRTRDEWAKVFHDDDCCVTPVLDMVEAPEHPHLAERGTFLEQAGVVQPGPAPRFSRTVPTAGAPHRPGNDTVQLLAEAGYGEAEVEALQTSGIVGTRSDAWSVVEPDQFPQRMTTHD